MTATAIFAPELSLTQTAHILNLPMYSRILRPLVLLILSAIYAKLVLLVNFSYCYNYWTIDVLLCSVF